MGRQRAHATIPAVKLRDRLRPTLIDRYIFREIVPFTLLGLLLFTFVLLLPQIAEMMGFLVSRSADPLTVIKIFLYFTPHILALTIPMSVLLGVLLAFGRMGSESEIIALRASGVSPAHMLRPAVFVALIGTLITFYITADVYPRANHAYRDLTTSLVAGHARAAIRAHVITDDLLPSRTMVLFVSNVVSSTGEWQDIVLRDKRTPARPRLVLARRGRLVVSKEAGEARLDLEDGAVYSFNRTDPKVWEEHQFSYRQLQLPFRELFPPKVEFGKGPRGLTLLEVTEEIARAHEMGTSPTRLTRLHIEWHKRFAIAVACLVFGLFGVGLSLGQKKEARSAAFVLSVAAILVYYSFLRFGEQFGVRGDVSPSVGMWAANVLFGAVGVLLLVLNQREAAFDPLDPARYAAWLPRVRRRAGPPPRRARILKTAEPLAPRPRLRLWGLLDGYIATSYIGHLLLATLTFWSLTLLLEFMDLVDDISQHGLPWRVLFKYLAFVAPDRLTLVLPVAFLVGTLTTLGLMARRNEITAMKAGGISVYRVALPVMAAAVLGGVVLFGLSEFLAPYTNRIARQERDVIKGRPFQSSARQVEERMVLGRSGRFYYLTSARGKPEVLHAFWSYDVDPESWRLRQCLFAAQARWNRQEGFYDLEHGWRRRVSPAPAFRTFDSIRTREIEPPDYFRRDATTSAGTLRFGELRAHIDELAALGIDVVRLEVDLHRKLALPAVAVVMALLGIPFAFVVGRRGALYGIGLALMLAIVYWSCFKVFEGLGVNALLDPALAMWAPNILFAGAAVYLLLCLDT